MTNNNSYTSVCEWFKCAKQASRHVQFGLRVFDVGKDDDIHDMPYTIAERNLCAEHIAHVRDQFIHVDVTDLHIHPDLTNDA